MLGKTRRQKEKGAAEAWWTDSIPNSVDVILTKLQETEEDRRACYSLWDRRSPTQDSATEPYLFEKVFWTWPKMYLI